MKRIFLWMMVATVAIACSKNAVTGRSQLTLLPESQLQAMATQQYAEFLSTNKVVSSSVNRDAEMVSRIGQRIKNAVQSYYSSKGLANELNGYKWEYRLVENS